MKLYQAVDHRYATKRYDRHRALDGQMILKLKHIALMSPSSINSQPWRISFVEEPLLKERLAEASYFNREKIIEAPLLIVMARCSNLAKFELWLAATQSPAAVEYYDTFLKPLSTEEIFAWFDNQLYLSLGMLLAACATMELDSTPMEGIDRARYDMLLAQEDYTARIALAVGYRAQDDANDPATRAKSRREMGEVIWSL